METLSPLEHITRLTSYEDTSYRKKWGVASALFGIGLISVIAHKKNMFKCIFMRSVASTMIGSIVYFLGPSMMIELGSASVISLCM